MTAILQRLADDWLRLTISPDDLRRANSWSLPGTEVRTLDEVLCRCGYLVRPSFGSAPQRTPWSTRVTADHPDRDEHDAYLLELLRAARDEPLAARIVLQRILPSLCAMARRHSNSATAQTDLVGDLVANAWQAIRDYPIERRPRRVVSNLVRDIGFETMVRPTRRRLSSEVSMAHHQMRDSEYVTDVEPLDELVEILRDARGRGMSPNDIELICDIVSLERPESVATQRSVTTRTVRNHRDSIVARLRYLATTAA